MFGAAFCVERPAHPERLETVASVLDLTQDVDMREWSISADGPGDGVWPPDESERLGRVTQGLGARLRALGGRRLRRHNVEGPASGLQVSDSYRRLRDGREVHGTPTEDRR
jgi:hypothetical protein